MHRGKAVWGHSKKVAIYKPRKEASGKVKPLTPWPWTSSLQNCEKINFCCLNHSVSGILLWQPKQTNTGTMNIFFFSTRKRSLLFSSYRYIIKINTTCFCELPCFLYCIVCFLLFLMLLLNQSTPTPFSSLTRTHHFREWKFHPSLRHRR